MYSNRITSNIHITDIGIKYLYLSLESLSVNSLEQQELLFARKCIDKIIYN